MHVSKENRENNKNRILNKPKPYTIKRGLIVLVVVFLFILTSIAWSNDQFTTKNTAIADGQNLVSVYYDGQNKTVATSATTVREALDKMGVELQKGDVVEPSLDSQISRGVTNINVYRSFSYLVVDGDDKIPTTSGYRSPKKVIEQAGIKLYPEDIVTSDRVDEFIQDDSVGQRLIIQRATPVTVVLAGQVFEFRTHQKTVGELFEEKNLDVRPQDITSTSLDTLLEKNMKIVVSRLSQDIISEEISVEPPVIQNIDYTKPVGYSEVQDPGSAGKRIKRSIVTIQDGVEQSRAVLEEKEITPPKPKVLVIGPSNITSSEGWVKLRFCESGGNYANKNNPLYRGAYQFAYSTWNNFGGYSDPADAPPDVQDAKALQLYNARGASPWPNCGRYLR